MTTVGPVGGQQGAGVPAAFGQGGTASPREQRVSARGKATVVQVGGSVITGDVFVGRFARLRDVWLDPGPVFEEVQVERFVGREWLLGLVDRFLDSHDRGYVVVHADAGLGKTMVAAWLAYSREWACHFTRRRKGRVAATALRNLAAQLIARYELGDRFAPGGMLPEVAGEPGWFEQVLRAAAESARAAGGRVVLVVDGLDEAEQIAGDLPLGLPAVLPRGAFVVVTCRTGTDLPALRRPWKILAIHAQDRHNTDDLRRFLHTTATSDPVVRGLLVDAGMDVGAFVAQLLDGCDGVWVYLRYVLDELRLGLRALPGIGQLPTDLAGYYAESLLPPPGADADWGALRRPLLAMLAVAAEPLPVIALTRLAGLPDSHAVAGLCGRWLRPFLATVTAADGERRYGIYHVSLRDFLVGAGAGPMDSDGVRAEDLAAAATHAHGQIADYYLAMFGELPGLPRLAVDPKLGGADSGYALRHLTHHLEWAGRAGETHALLAAESDAAGLGNVWYSAHDQAGTANDYISDLHRARRLVTAQVDADVAAGQVAAGLGLELRYTLIGAAVATLAATIAPALVSRLVGAGRWTPARAVGHARQLRDPEDRALALARLVPEFAAVTDGPDLLPELRNAVAITDEYRRPWLLAALVELLPDLPPEIFAADALAAAQDLEDDDKASALARLAKVLPEPLLPEALGMVRRVGAGAERAWALASLVARLPDSLLSEVLAEARRVDGYERATLLAAVGPRLVGAERDAAVAAAYDIGTADDRAWALAALAGESDQSGEQLVADALEAARSVTEPYLRAWALAAVTRPLPAAARAPVFEEALAAARTATDSDRAWALACVVEALPDHEQAPIVAETLRAAAAVESDEDRADVLARLAPHLGRWSEEALQVAAAIKAESHRATALAALAAHLSDSTLKTALKMAAGLGDEDERGLVLVALCPRLPEGDASELLASVGRFSDAGVRSWVVGELAEHLPDRLLGEALGAVQSINGEYGRSQLLGRIAAATPGPEAQRLLAKAVAAARRIPFEFGRAQALTNLAYLVPAAKDILAEAAATAEAVPADFWRIYALDRLLPLLSPPQRDQCLVVAFANARDISLSPDERSWWLAELSRHLPVSDQRPVLDEAIAAAREIDQPEARALMLAELAVHIPERDRGALLDESRSAVRAVGSEAKLSYRLVARAASLLPDALVVQTLRPARGVLRENGDPAAAVAAGEVARHLPASLLLDGLAAARVLDQHYQAQAFGTLALHMPASVQEQILTRAFGAEDRLVARQAVLAQATALWKNRLTQPQLNLIRRCLEGIELDDTIGVLAAGTDLIQRAGGDAALTNVLATVEAIRRWWPQTRNLDNAP